jgi:hypothetical protein
VSLACHHPRCKRMSVICLWNPLRLRGCLSVAVPRVISFGPGLQAHGSVFAVVYLVFWVTHDLLLWQCTRLVR